MDDLPIPAFLLRKVTGTLTQALREVAEANERKIMNPREALSYARQHDPATIAREQRKREANQAYEAKRKALALLRKEKEQARLAGLTRKMPLQGREAWAFLRQKKSQK